ncbi:polymeric immunoglobulin receptor-like [Seriola aureovittata]|uniref:polymeric immunoglobulin receptor-like n=1 Tax=Seriola aureovittata TaxID=2871759 RepID=UPI0024BDA382|nr:polymeric immunoglobulin receptor-like [Seriola aureovittata]
MKQRDLQNLLLIFCTLSCVSGAAPLIHVSGYEGRDVKISCPYGEGYESYEKYLCRNDCGNGDDVLIMTTQANKNKYSISDDINKRVLTTTISDLSSVDAGKYWCGVTRTGKDYYPAEVRLDIVPDSCCDQFNKIHSHEEGSVSIPCPYDSKYQNNLKYICRGRQPSICLQTVVVTSNRKLNGKFTLTGDEESGNFTVTITNLTQKDSGWFLCGVERNNGLDVFSAVKLEVKEWCCVKSISLSGTVGHPLTMQCPYPSQHRTNRKFLCKGNRRNNCEIQVTSQNSGQTRNRFTLQDDASSSSFSVRITELRAGDAGTYWCGSDSQWSIGDYTKIHLSAVFPTRTIIPITSQTATVKSQSTQITDKPIKVTSLLHPVVFIVPTVLLLILILALVLLCKYKCYKVKGAGVIVNQNVIKQADVEEVIGEDIYANEEVMVCSKVSTSKQQSNYRHYDDTEDQEDSVYQNCATTDDIYCNEFLSKGNKR